MTVSYILYLNRNGRKRTFRHAHLTKPQISLRQSDQRHRCPHEDTFHHWLSKMCPAKILIRLRKCAV